MELLIFLLIVIIIGIIANIKIVPQAHEYVIEFLGKYRTTWSAGLHIKIPFIKAGSCMLTEACKMVFYKMSVIAQPSISSKSWFSPTMPQINV